MKKLFEKKGFSIVELLVTLAVSGVLVALLTRGYIMQKRSSESEADLRDMNLKTQMAMSQIKQYLRNAGLGAEDNLTANTGSFQRANNTPLSDVFTFTPRSDGPDTITVITGFPSQTQVSCAAGTCVSQNVVVDDAAAFNTETGRYIFAAPSIRNRFLEVAAVAGNTLTLNETVTVHDGDPVYRLSAYTITLDRNGDDSELDVDSDNQVGDGDDQLHGDENPDLYIYNNLEDLTDETDCKVSEGVEDIQFQFLLEDDMDTDTIMSATELSTWHDNVPASNLDDIRAVRIWLLVRSDRPDHNHEDLHEDGGSPKTYQVADHHIQLDTDDDNGIDSLYDHRYHRLLSVETVMIRNRNL